MPEGRPGGPAGRWSLPKVVLAVFAVLAVIPFPAVAITIAVVVAILGRRRRGVVLLMGAVVVFGLWALFFLDRPPVAGG
ncbi:hypothetical protein [Isoptericola sp. BMS4]|uniref:hypothetical protein n=1 Tax=Isoptericola sp. BMS4 TaxID=2527875 RepID=UPI0014234B19|nr:hypothetical protein [Isoptericola sp. BMS4]